MPPRYRINWDDYGMLQAIVASMRSPDPNTQVGAYICSPGHKPLSTGYNSTPRNIDPVSISWEREGEPLDTKYPFIAHAEKNAVLNATADLTDSLLYVTLYPCNNCAIDIIQKGIKEVIYLRNPYEDTWQVKASKQMFTQTRVTVRQHTWQVLPHTLMAELSEKLGDNTIWPHL